MKRIIIEGNKPLSGKIKIGGAKNSVVALIPAAIMAKGNVHITNVPNISDKDALIEILKLLNVKVETNKDIIDINASCMTNTVIPETLSNKLRASYYFMGSLLARYKHVEMYFPGGCNIGSRPIDLHLKGFEALGATITKEESKYIIDAKKLTGANIFLDFASVGATINIMIASTMAEGTTTISNAAREAEIVNIADLLNNMGAKIRGAGTSSIEIEGVSYLGKCFHEVIPDRIEAGTYVILGAAVGENLKVDNIIPEHIESLTSKLEEMGVFLDIGADYIIVSKQDNYKAIHVKTQTYPGFPTDLQQPLTPLLTACKGQSKIEETIYENRFMHIPYLNSMGADIRVKNQTSTVIGPTKLVGCDVVATDLRAGASLVIAGLMADGTTKITNVEHILRGYENIVEKLTNVGAKVEIREI